MNHTSPITTALADFYKIFHYEGDERYEPFQATVRGNADVVYTLGYPGDGEHGKKSSLDKSRVGTGGPGYCIPAEFNDIRHEKGVLSMARETHQNTAGSQFFVMTVKNAGLDGRLAQQYIREQGSGLDVAAQPAVVDRRLLC